MKLLMHICCANCSLFPLQSFFFRNIDVVGFWYNPNIHPYTEYVKRRDALRQLQRLWAIDVEYLDHYGLKEFLRAVVHREDERCAICYAMRLDSTAETAKRMGFDGFTTTLLVSPYQKFDALVRIGTEIGEQYGIPFIADDFRPGWKEGMNRSRELGLYRQAYCGCIYSEMERYRSRGKTSAEAQRQSGDKRGTHRA